MELYPAIDIRAGGAVRLTQGDFDRQQDYGDPVVLARLFVAAGARWLHVVDLDAARSGRPVNRARVLEIAEAVEVPVQSGGGVRTADDVDELLEGGVARVVLGTVALEDPNAVRTLADARPGRVAVGLDYRRVADGRSELAVRGWEHGTGQTLEDVVRDLSGTRVAAVVVTAIERDGTLGGPDLDGLGSVLAATDLPVIASGGVGGVSDLVALAGLRGPGGRVLAGAITGKALVDGRLTVEEGVAACAPSG